MRTALSGRIRASPGSSFPPCCTDGKGGPEFRGNLSGFPDGEAASPYAVPALGWAVEEGILRGDKQGMLRPGDMVRRDQLAVILFRCAQTHAVLYGL